MEVFMLRVWDFDNFLNDWFDDKKRYKTNLDISIDEDDDIEFKDGKLYISKKGINSDVVVSCDSWKSVINAVVEGAAKDEKEKRVLEAKKQFAENLVADIRDKINAIDDNNILRINLSGRAYSALMQYKIIVYNSWKTKYSLKKVADMKDADYRIFVYDDKDDVTRLITGSINGYDVE